MRLRSFAAPFVLTLVVSLAGPVAQTTVPASAVTQASAQGASTALASTALVAKKKKQKQAYSPKTGPIFNDPRFKKSKDRIIRHIIRSVDATPTGELIRVHSWNIASSRFVNHLISAHRRGVSVRVLMSRGKVEDQGSRGDFSRLKRALSNPSESHPQPKGERSWARSCNRSCRGKRGIAHTKSYVFSQAGKSQKVVMVSSANATEVSAKFQWNDMFTVVGNDVLYRKFLDIFAESGKDKKAKRPYQTVSSGPYEAYWYPWAGKDAKGDRVIKSLKKISCKGAKGNTGTAAGRTRIRIAMDAILNDRGIKIGKRLARLYEQGCDIHITYALMGNQVLQVVRHTSRGAIPIRQIVQDFNNDGIYDRYLHAKVMTVSGVYGKDRSAQIVWNGTENWSGLALLSDEVGMEVRKQGALRKYERWINHLFANPPRARTAAVAARARALGVDPYSQMEHN